MIKYGVEKEELQKTGSLKERINEKDLDIQLKKNKKKSEKKELQEKEK